MLLFHRVSVFVHLGRDSVVQFILTSGFPSITITEVDNDHSSKGRKLPFWNELTTTCHRDVVIFTVSVSLLHQDIVLL